MGPFLLGQLVDELGQYVTELG
ncbi:hypothetical protein F383_10854 [Gossypium arboreum]|uniref:Uncharacterized protein n=1 Tax=Gossypium arboreum TaxID=29729 RepID=A0A0B0PV39_GOSAR|nr:hypothetical protein F383_10854 [Gossypium arboreum]